MIQAMYAGISGMKAFKTELDVIGNNIANSNTNGYKSSRATFKEMLSQTLSGATAPSESLGGINPTQIGLGVVTGSIDVDNGQGPMNSTGRQSDLAIQGEGYFSYSDGSSVVYSRDGALGYDGANNLVSASTGYRLLGWAADPNTGAIDTTQPITRDSSIEIPIGKLSTARQTSSVDLKGNLDATQSKTADPYKIDFSIYDSLGIAHKMQVSFSKTDNTVITNPDASTKELATWKYDIYCPDVDASTPVKTGNITFSDTGHSNLDSTDISLAFSGQNGSVQPLNATINMSDIQQFGSKSSVTMSDQDGLVLGTLDSYNVDKNGLITGTFTNGSTRTLGQLAIAQFNNPSGLSRIGNNMLKDSPNSGAPSMGAPGQGGRGSIASTFLEGSNVDLATEFANMIVAQRGFQASSRIITTSDDILQELVQLKR